MRQTPGALGAEPPRDGGAGEDQNRALKCASYVRKNSAKLPAVMHPPSCVIFSPCIEPMRSRDTKSANACTWARARSTPCAPATCVRAQRARARAGSRTTAVANAIPHGRKTQSSSHASSCRAIHPLPTVASPASCCAGCASRPTAPMCAAGHRPMRVPCPHDPTSAKPNVPACGAGNARRSASYGRWTPHRTPSSPAATSSGI